MIKIIKIILFLILTPIVSAEEIRIEAEAYWLDSVTWNPLFSSSMLVDSSLVASGLSGERHNQYKNQYMQLIENFRKDLGSSFYSFDSYEQGKFILTWLHNNIFNRYIESQTFMDNLIDTGNYNCVSSSILYSILSREVDLKTNIVETVDHAFCSIETNKGWIDVETTTAYGFDPGVKQEFHKEFGKTGYTYVPPGAYRKRKIINDRDSIALILQNRMSQLQKENHHNKVIGIAVDRWTLSGSKKSLKEMNDSFRNWAAILNNRGLYKQAYDLIGEVSTNYELITLNQDLLYDLTYNHIIELVNSKNYNTAKIFLNTVVKLLDDSDKAKLENIINKANFADVVRNGTYNDTLPLIRKAFKVKSISKIDWENWITVLHQNRALEISKISGWLDAWNYLKALPNEEKKLRSIINLSKQASSNWTSETHNKFANLFNAQNFDDAEQVLLDGLILDPSNKVLSKDLANLKKIHP